MVEKERKKISVAISDLEVLFAVYMPFLTSHGLFIPTKKLLEIGQEIELTLSLLNEPTKYVVGARVVWITPVGAQGNKAPGIGVQFEGTAGEALKNKIENVLASDLQSDKRTHTM